MTLPPLAAFDAMRVLRSDPELFAAPVPGATQPDDRRMSTCSDKGSDVAIAFLDEVLGDLCRSRDMSW